MIQYVLFYLGSRVYSYYEDKGKAEAKLVLAQEPACIYRLTDFKVLVRNYYIKNPETKGRPIIIFPKNKEDRVWI
jgi:hypothetical protein